MGYAKLPVPSVLDFIICLKPVVGKYLLPQTHTAGRTVEVCWGLVGKSLLYSVENLNHNYKYLSLQRYLVCHSGRV